MSRFVCVYAFLIVLAFAATARAGEIVEVRLLTDKQMSQFPATQPSADATIVVSIEALTEASGNFHASCVVGEKTIQLDGNVKTTTEGTRKLRISFLHQEGFRPAPVNTESITTSIELHLNEQRVISWFPAGQRMIVATIKPQPEPGKANARAE